MCLAIPGQIVEIVDHEHQIARVEVAGVRRNVNVGLVVGGENGVEIGSWVLIHVGFAMSVIDEEEAKATREFLELLGDPYKEELAELKGSAIE